MTAAASPCCWIEKEKSVIVSCSPSDGGLAVLQRKACAPALSVCGMLSTT